MSEDNNFYLVVPVTIPESIQPEDLVSYLNKFIEIGLNDLKETVDDENIESDELDEVIVNETTWGQPLVEKKY